MEAPTVQYVATSDDVSIAFTSLGHGPPLVYLQPYSHQQLDWDHVEMQEWYRALAETHTLIRFDARGFGLSQRSLGEFSISRLVLDLEAVVDRLGLEQFDLFGVGGLGFVAATFAAEHPDRVSRLILWGTPPGGDVFLESQRTRSLRAILEFDEDLANELQTRYVFGERAVLTPERLAHARHVVSAEHLDTYITTLFDHDIRDRLRAIVSPTLVIYPSETSYISSEAAQAVAALTPECEFIQVDAGYYPYQATDQARCVAQIDRFLNAIVEEPPRSSFGGFQTLLFTDLEASTPLTQRLGDEGAQELLRGHNESVRTALRDHGGREVKHTGDGIMASFPSAVSAVTAALQIQRELAGGEVRVRVGLNAGEPIAEDEDLFGLSVIKAARVADRAEPGQVLVSRVVRELCEGKTFQFASLGAVSLKGFDEAVELFEVAG